MLDRETIKTLMLLPEVDMTKATKLQFSNSDKKSVDVNLTNSGDGRHAAFYTTQVAVDKTIPTTPEIQA